jgi:hypothetical protein
LSVTRRERIRAYGSAAAMVVVGGIVGLTVKSTVGEVIRLSMITLGLGAVVILVFYEVGLSEDHARAREEEERRPRDPEPTPHPETQRRPRLPRRPRRPD